LLRRTQHIVGFEHEQEHQPKHKSVKKRRQPTWKSDTSAKFESDAGSHGL
jgi:hypothetical protein